MTKLLLAGATGLVGAAALKLLLADERVTRVVAPTRRALPPHAKLLNGAVPLSLWLKVRVSEQEKPHTTER